ncbi:helix-turn-helix domain-containing protein [Paenibacillus silvisoli]
MLPLSHQEIANVLGASREAVNIKKDQTVNAGPLFITPPK